MDWLGGYTCQYHPLTGKDDALPVRVNYGHIRRLHLSTPPVDRLVSPYLSTSTIDRLGGYTSQRQPWTDWEAVAL